jgi:nicotinamidase-related amidase
MPPTIVRGFAADNNHQGDRTLAGVGADIGPVKLDDGTIVEGGKVLMRDQWNSNVYDPLSSAAEPHDLRVYKNRLSGFWGGTEVEKALESRGIRTLLFAGCNTDQCVAFSLMDAVSKGWDCLLLSDGCATTSPEFAKDMVEYNMGGWGFLLNCRDLADGVHTIETSQGAEVTHVDDGNKTQGDTSQVLQ